jgi:hypothetical protein
VSKGSVASGRSERVGVSACGRIGVKCNGFNGHNGDTANGIQESRVRIQRETSELGTPNSEPSPANLERRYADTPIPEGTHARVELKSDSRYRRHCVCFPGVGKKSAGFAKPA